MNIIASLIMQQHYSTALRYLFTNFFDEWTSNDYQTRIYNEEYIKADPPFEMERPLKLAKIVSEVLGKEFKPKSILDYGGGEGTLVNLLIQKGAF